MIKMHRLLLTVLSVHLYLVNIVTCNCDITISVENNCTILNVDAPEMQCFITDMFPNTPYYFYTNKSAEALLLVHRRRSGVILKKFGPYRFRDHHWNQLEMTKTNLTSRATDFYFNGAKVGTYKSNDQFIYVRLYSIDSVRWCQNCHPDKHEPRLFTLSLTAVWALAAATFATILVTAVLVYVLTKKKRAKAIPSNPEKPNTLSATLHDVEYDDIEDSSSNVQNTTAEVTDYSSPHQLDGLAQYSRMSDYQSANSQNSHTLSPEYESMSSS